MANKVVVYIDGYNLYFALRGKRLHGPDGRRWPNYSWLNVRQLGKEITKPGETLALVKYYTARIRAIDGDPASLARQRRQATYLDALGGVDGLEVIYGAYQLRDVACRACGHAWRTGEEKKTDVNIATDMVMDGVDGLYDRAVLVSADSDLAPPVSMIATRLPGRSVAVAFPPGRGSRDLTAASGGRVFHINEAMVRRSQFPRETVTSAGHVVTRPVEWR